jgi:RNA polymerase sigma-70 factor (ECF subfamily)
VNANSGGFAGIEIDVPSFDFDTVFHSEYRRLVRVIARVVRDPARAEELAAEALWKLSKTPKAQGENYGGWLYRTATRAALDELRRSARREKYEKFFGLPRRSPTPEELHLESEEQRRVRGVLAKMKANQAELLILRSDGLTYDEIAQALDLNPSSVGTLLSRAEATFRKEYVRRYGQA